MNFTVNKPLHGHDEDAPPYADERMLIVCDGLGGGGQNSYIVDGEKRTSAYLGSRAISEICKDYFSSHFDEFWESEKKLNETVSNLKSEISRLLDIFVEEKGLKNIVKGKSMQMLPSTLAAILYRSCGEHTDALVISAGDSRAYVLTPENGLRQLSKDDVFDDVDAFEKSATMTNNIRQGGDFFINYNRFELPQKCILFVCTDGCFDYISTPMEFEYRLEYSLSKCGDLLNETENAFGKYYGDVLVKSGLNDDCTVAGAIVGYSESTETKELFLQRALWIQNEYRGTLTSLDKETSKRKEETRENVSILENKISKLSYEVEKNLKLCLTESFKHDISEDKEAFGAAVQAISAKINEYEPYKAYIEDSVRNQSAMEEIYTQKKSTYNNQMKTVRAEFDNARFEEYIKEASSSVNPLNFLNRDRARIVDEYKTLSKSLNASGNLYYELLEKFSLIFEKYKERDIRKFNATEEIVPLAQAFEQMKAAYEEFISAKENIRLCRKAMRKMFLDEVGNGNDEFIAAVKTGFVDYRQKPAYEYVTKLSADMRELHMEVEKSKPLSAEKRAEQFGTFLSSEYGRIFAFLKKEFPLQSICGKNYEALVDAEKELEGIKKYLDEPNAEKRRLWEKYKTTYEFFKSGSGGKA